MLLQVHWLAQHWPSSELYYQQPHKETRASQELKLGRHQAIHNRRIGREKGEEERGGGQEKGRQQKDRGEGERMGSTQGGGKVREKHAFRKYESQQKTYNVNSTN